MAIAFVQGNGSFLVTSAASWSVTLAAAVGSGNTVCGICSYSSSGGISNVTDDKGNTYSLETEITDSTNLQKSTAFSRSNITNGPKTITFNMVGTFANLSIIADEFSGCGIATTDQRDSTAHGGQFQSAPGTGTNGVTSGNFTTVTAGDLLYGCTMNGGGDDSGTLTAGTTSNATFSMTGTTSGVSSNGAAMLKSEWAVQSATSATTAATFTESVNTDRNTYLIAIKAGPAAAAGPRAGIVGFGAAEW